MTALTLPRDFTVLNIASIAAEAMRALAEQRTVSIEMDAVERIDTAGIQLLLLLKREAHDRGIDLRLNNFSDAVKELIAFYRLQQVFRREGEQE